MDRVALLGGIYSNHLALAEALRDARRRGAERIYCLGDLGAFGPHPDRVFPLLEGARVECVQGNYDHSIGNGLDDCRCGYTDPRDNHYARLSYEYTLRNTSPPNRRLLAALPSEVRFTMAGRRVLLCHGSPRRTNEFLWESTTPDAFLERLLREHEADLVFATHTGIKWQRRLPSGGLFANVGVLGRPENDGTPRVWYTLLTSRITDGLEGPAPAGPERERAPPCSFPGADPDLEVEFVPVDYDHRALAAEMREERLPEEFVETVLTGWWTTCLEVLPAKERARGRY